VIEELGTTDFGRVKVGVGRSGDGELSDYLLSDFEESEKALVKKIAGVAADALLVALGAGFVTAMNRFNSVDLGVKGSDAGD
jgi:PTH1 family peptidyl-tRNA hydrolase